MLLAKQGTGSPLGMIPSWQYDSSWAQNPKYNQFVQFPPGVDQLTPQPIGPNYALPPEPGLGRLPRQVLDDCCGQGNPECCQALRSRQASWFRQLRGLALGTYSKWALVGGIALVSATIIGGVMLARHK